MVAKSIIDIEVNDEKFKAFFDLYSRYKATLGENASDWAKAGAEVETVGSNFAQMTAAMLAQLELLHNQTQLRSKERNDADKAARAQAAADRTQVKAAQDRARATRQVLEDSRRIAASVLSTTITLVKWASLGSVFGGLLGGGTLFGIDRLADAVSGQRRMAQGVGITAGQQIAYGVNFGRYVDTNANLENIAEARSDYSKRWAFSAMGVNPDGKDPATLALEMVTKAKSLFDRSDQSQQFASSHGLLQFYTMDELRRLHATSVADLRASSAGYGRDLGSLSNQDAVQKRWQDFSIQMKRAGLQIEATFVRGLEPLVPNLNRLSSSFADAVEKLMANGHLKEWVDDLSSGLGHFADYVGSDKFSSDVKTFVDDVGALAEGVVNALRWLGLIPAKAGADGVPPVTSANTAPGAAARAAAAGKFNNLTSSQFSAYGKAMAFFMGQGWSEPQAAGIVGNLVRESGLDPTKVNKKSGMVGVAQWDHARRAALAKFAGVDDWTKTTLDQQYAFINHELRGSESKSGTKLQRQQNAFTSGSVVSRDYERAGKGFFEQTFEETLRGVMSSDLQGEMDKRDFGNMRSMAERLRRTRSVRGVQTLRSLLQDYEGPKANIAAELKAVSAESGLGADAQIDVRNDATLSKLVAALEHQKNPAASYSPGAVVTIINQTGGSAVVSANQVSR